MKKSKEELKKYFETGDKPTQQQYADLIDSYLDRKQPEGEANRRFVIDETGEVFVKTEEIIPEYTFSDIIGNKLSLLKSGKTVKEIDLSLYLDDTNLARLVSGKLDAKGIATFKRDDNSIFTIDLSNLKEDSLIIISDSKGVQKFKTKDDLKFGDYHLFNTSNNEVKIDGSYFLNITDRLGKKEIQNVSLVNKVAKNPLSILFPNSLKRSLDVPFLRDKTPFNYSAFYTLSTNIKFYTPIGDGVPPTKGIFRYKIKPLNDFSGMEEITLITLEADGADFSDLSYNYLDFSVGIFKDIIQFNNINHDRIAFLTKSYDKNGNVISNGTSTVSLKSTDGEPYNYLDARFQITLETELIFDDPTNSANLNASSNFRIEHNYTNITLNSAD